MHSEIVWLQLRMSTSMKWAWNENYRWKFNFTQHCIYLARNIPLCWYIPGVPCASRIALYSTTLHDIASLLHVIYNDIKFVMDLKIHVMSCNLTQTLSQANVISCNASIWNPRHLFMAVRTAVPTVTTLHTFSNFCITVHTSRKQFVKV